MAEHGRRPHAKSKLRVSRTRLSTTDSSVHPAAGSRLRRQAEPCVLPVVSSRSLPPSLSVRSPGESPPPQRGTLNACTAGLGNERCFLLPLEIPGEAEGSILQDLRMS